MWVSPRPDHIPSRLVISVVSAGRGLCSPRPFTLTTAIKETLNNLTESAVSPEREAVTPPGSNIITEIR